MVNLWKDINLDKKVPRVVDAVVEVPKLSRNKYEYERNGGLQARPRVTFPLPLSRRLRFHPPRVAGASAARQAIARAMEQYKKKFG